MVIIIDLLLNKIEEDRPFRKFGMLLYGTNIAQIISPFKQELNAVMPSAQKKKKINRNPIPIKKGHIFTGLEDYDIQNRGKSFRCVQKKHIWKLLNTRHTK